MSLLNEYIKKGIDIRTLENELIALIKRYNIEKNTYLFVYSTAINKRIPDIALQQEDYYIIADLLRETSTENLDFYIETPGGSGEAAEEIVRCLREKSDNITFIVSGEAKSAGTLIVLSGNEIMMTKTGSLGPIDAQVRIGRSQISAMDYKEWIENKHEEAEEKKYLNPVDATIIAQISPGELQSVYQSLSFAEDLVTDWLPKYKFKNWAISETKKIPITEKIKVKRAKEIVDKLTDRDQWHSHGRSIKIDDLDGLLKIIRIDDDPNLKDLVYRIQMICKLIFDSSTNYKIFATADYKIFKSAAQIPSGILPLKEKLDVVEVDVICPKCSKQHKIYIKFTDNSKIDEDFQNKGSKPYPSDNKFKCDCGFSIDLAGVRNQIEMQLRKKIVTKVGRNERKEIRG
jgi:hypothetical protein